MSVIVTLRMKADPARLEEVAAQNPERMREIVDIARGSGVLAHRFYGADDGQVMVIDEWPDADSFNSFFESTADRIGPLMQDTGVEGPPEVTIWRKLQTHDDLGWGA